MPLQIFFHAARQLTLFVDELHAPERQMLSYRESMLAAENAIFPMLNAW